MARSKSTPGSKADRTNTSTSTSTTKDQTNNSNLPEVKAVVAGATPAEVAAAEVAEVKVAPEPRKMEVVKSEPRKPAASPVPINLEDQIRRRAYELYLQRGPASGSEAEDWLTAEREVRQRYRQRSA
jgi:hypothetical protein